VAADEVSEYVERLNVMRIAIDSVEDDRVTTVAQTRVASDASEQVVLLRWWDFMRARRNREFRACVGHALSIPVSRSIAMAGRFLAGKRPTRYMPFDFVIRVLTSLEERGQSLYIFGGTGPAIRVVERNLRETFPGLRIVGRYAGYYQRQMEPSIITAIRKASPDLLLVGPGVPGRDLWSYRNRKNLATGLSLFSAEVFDIFSERRKRASRTAFRRGLDFLPDLVRRPWRMLRAFVYVWFLVLLLVFRALR
jgi:N-acetylglucosaminyldiphosphoundecaprenol N-acetyl-beta-D-mannosaminyltransferase